jgi:hypothetical protein
MIGLNYIFNILIQDCEFNNNWVRDSKDEVEFPQTDYWGVLLTIGQCEGVVIIKNTQFLSHIGMNNPILTDGATFNINFSSIDGKILPFLLFSRLSNCCRIKAINIFKG